MTARGAVALGGELSRDPELALKRRAGFGQLLDVAFDTVEARLLGDVSLSRHGASITDLSPRCHLRGRRLVFASCFRSSADCRSTVCMAVPERPKMHGPAHSGLGIHDAFFGSGSRRELARLRYGVAGRRMMRAP